MGKNPENNLIQTLNEQTGDDLSMTSKPVLVQNQLGIFFGFLKKADTRKGTALLSHGYAIDPRKHLTFTQYLRFLRSEDMGNILTPNAVRKTALENTITDYATEGVAMYYIDSFNDGTDFYDISDAITPAVELLSLTGIYAIAPVSDDGEDAKLHWEDLIIRSEKWGEHDEFDITVKETFIVIDCIGRGAEGAIIQGTDGSIREVKYSSDAIRPLILKDGSDE